MRATTELNTSFQPNDQIINTRLKQVLSFHIQYMYIHIDVDVVALILPLCYNNILLEKFHTVNQHIDFIMRECGCMMVQNEHVHDVRIIMNDMLKTEFAYLHNMNKCIVIILPLCYNVECLNLYTIKEHQRRIMEMVTVIYPQHYPHLDANLVRYHVINARRVLSRYNECWMTS